MCVHVYRVCIYVGARYYRIILGYFTGAQSKPRTCANSFTDDRYSLAGENKRKRMEDKSSPRVCMVWRYSACEGYTLKSWARGSSWIIEILAQGVVSCQCSRDCSLAKSIPLAVSIFSSIITIKVLLIEYYRVRSCKSKITKDCNYFFKFIFTVYTIKICFFFFLVYTSRNLQKIIFRNYIHIILKFNTTRTKQITFQLCNYIKWY